MSDKKNVSVQVGPSFAGSLFLVFLVLKLVGIIDWSWWWVTAPLWGGLAVFLAILAAIILIALGGLALAGLANFVRGRK